ncbi:MAG: PQQ-binding-like beta-propeller repeat protein, partial [Planctomycetales bacterium]
NIAWSVELPGWGTSSPVVVGDRVYVTSQVEADGKKSLLTLCYRKRDGRELWRHDFGFGHDQKTHETSNLACITPAADEEGVVAGFGNAEFARYSRDGQLEWVTRLVPIMGRASTAWGFGSSPIIEPDAVLLPYEHQGDPCYLLGLDQRTGEIAWRKGRPLGANYATPLVLEHGGRRIVVATGKHRLTAFDAGTRAQLWQYGEGEGMYNGEIVGSPTFGDGMLFGQLWRKDDIHALRLDENGGPPTPLWESAKPGPEEPSLLYYRGLLYALMDNGVITCFDARTGEELYRERLGGNCTASPVAGGGHVYLCNHDGRTFVLRAGRKFELLATNELGERFSASPAITGRQLILRTSSHLYCVGRPDR